METLRLLTALQQRGGYINLSGLKPLELVRLGKMHDRIDVRRRVEKFGPNFALCQMKVWKIVSLTDQQMWV